MKIAVLIPAKNENTCIAQTIYSVMKAGIPVGDIFVVDDGSSDSTGDIARGFNVNVKENVSSSGKAVAISTAARYFHLTQNYDAIALLDADTQISPEYFSVIRQAFEQNPNAAAVCGRPKSNLPASFLTSYRAFSYFVGHFIFKSGQNVMQTITVLPGCASVYKTDVFDKIDWSDGTQVEDASATMQIHRMGLPIVYTPDATVLTQDPRTIKGYFKQMLRWNRGTFRVASKYRVWPGWKRIDCELKLLLSEGLLYSTIVLLLPLFFYLRPALTMKLILLDTLITVLFAAIVARKEQRPDVLFYSPAFGVLKIFDAFNFLYAALSYRQQKEIRGWVSPARY